MKKILLCTTMFLFMAGQTAMAAKYNWDMPNIYQESSFHGQVDKYFAETLASETDGQIKITHHFGGSLGYKTKEQLDAVQDGDIIIADTYMGLLSGFDPIFMISSLPFLTPSIEHSQILWNITKPYYQKLLAKRDQKLLTAGPWPPVGIWSKDKVSNIDDLTKLKIRTFDSASTQVMAELNSHPMQLPWGDIIPQLGTKAINSVLTSAEAGINLNMWDLLTNFYDINYGSTLQMIHMNMDSFNSLPKDMQDAVLLAAEKTEAYEWELAKQHHQNLLGKLKEHTVAITDKDQKADAAFQKAATTIIEEWLKKAGPDGQAIMDEYRQQTKHLQ